MTDIVYILTNPAIPDLIKIGMTSGDVESRMRQLYSCGVPLPFECFLAVEVEDASKVERALHHAFGDIRENPRREFFRISPDKPAAIMELFAIRNVTPGHDISEDETDKAALNRAKKRRENYKHLHARVPEGALLTSVFNDEVTALAVGKRMVEFRGDRCSLSASALVVAREHGHDWLAIQGPQYWKYQDITLDARRDMDDDEFEDDE